MGPRWKHIAIALAFAARCLLGALAILLIAAPSAVGQAVDSFFVSVNGRDAWSGRRSSPNAQLTDGPFASLEHARDVVRGRSDRGVRGAVVNLRGGLWLLKESLAFGLLDGGVPAHPVVWQSFSGESARIAGAVRVGNWTHVLDSAALARLVPSARDSVVVAHIPSGVTLEWVSDGRNIQPVPPELIWNDTILTIARWPNTGWDQIVGVDSLNGTSIRIATDRLGRWAASSEGWVFGYWFWDWFASFLPLRGVDSLSRTLRVSGSPIYGIRPGQRYAVVNVLEELDAKGEYWIDAARRLIYVWPPSDPVRAEALLSVMTDPVIEVKQSTDLGLRGIVVEASRGIGILVQNAERVTIEAAQIRNVGGRGIEVKDGANNVIRDAKIADVGGEGIRISAGDRRTLRASGDLIENVRLSRYARWVHTMAPGIRLFGVGTTVRHCEFDDAPESGIVLEGNDHVIEQNIFHDLLLETRDAGAIDMGRDWTARGNVIRGNYFYSLGPPVPWRKPLMLQAVYLDDMASGTTVEDNIFDNAQIAVLVGGGRDNVIQGNVIIHSDPAVYMDARGRALIRLAGKPNSVWDNLVTLLNQARPDSSPYAERFPRLRTVLTDQPGEPIGNVFADNVIVGGTGFRFANVAPVIPIESGTVRIPSAKDGTWGRTRVQRFLDSLATAGVRHKQQLPEPVLSPLH